MFTSGVKRLNRRPGRLVLAGGIRGDAFRSGPGPVALRLGDLTLAETTPVRGEGAPNVWTFRFLLSDDLEAVMTGGSPLSVVANSVDLPFSPKVQALRSALTESPDLVREIAAKLRDGFVLTSKGELREPFAKRGAGLAPILDHYEHCDRVAYEIIGYHLHVVGGTLLGAARQNGAIDHDVDFDAAYLSGARDAASVKVEYMAFLRALLRRGESVRLVNHKGHIRRRHFKWGSSAARRQGAAPAEIDVFPAFIDAEDFYCRPTFVRIPGGEGLILPLRRTPFGDRDVWAPNLMVEKAIRVFGASWREPDPFWSKPKFPGFQEAISALTLSDDDLLSLAADMPARQAAELRNAVAAKRPVEGEAHPDRAP